MLQFLEMIFILFSYNLILNTPHFFAIIAVAWRIINQIYLFIHIFIFSVHTNIF